MPESPEDKPLYQQDIFGGAKIQRKWLVISNSDFETISEMLPYLYDREQLGVVPQQEDQENDMFFSFRGDQMHMLNYMSIMLIRKLLDMDTNFESDAVREYFPSMDVEEASGIGSIISTELSNRGISKSSYKFIDNVDPIMQIWNRWRWNHEFPDYRDEDLSDIQSFWLSSDIERYGREILLNWEELSKEVFPIWMFSNIKKSLKEGDMPPVVAELLDPSNQIIFEPNIRMHIYFDEADAMIVRIRPDVLVVDSEGKLKSVYDFKSSTFGSDSYYSDYQSILTSAGADIFVEEFLKLKQKRKELLQKGKKKDLLEIDAKLEEIQSAGLPVHIGYKDIYLKQHQLLHIITAKKEEYEEGTTFKTVNMTKSPEQAADLAMDLKYDFWHALNKKSDVYTRIKLKKETRKIPRARFISSAPIHIRPPHSYEVEGNQMILSSMPLRERIVPKSKVNKRRTKSSKLDPKPGERVFPKRLDLG